MTVGFLVTFHNIKSHQEIQIMTKLKIRSIENLVTLIINFKLNILLKKSTYLSFFQRILKLLVIKDNDIGDGS